MQSLCGRSSCRRPPSRPQNPGYQQMPSPGRLLPEVRFLASFLVSSSVAGKDLRLSQSAIGVGLAQSRFFRKWDSVALFAGGNL
jgi:hypothetical protein